MERAHIFERGSHSSVIEAARPIIEFLIKNKGLGIEVSPGKIDPQAGAKSKSIKFKKINEELYEMVVTHNSSRQEFKVITRLNFNTLARLLKEEKKTRDWNVNYIDMSSANKVSKQTTDTDLDKKYKVGK